MSDDPEHAGTVPSPSSTSGSGSGGGGAVVPVFRIGDVIQTRRPHPCGGDTWEIYRVGMDIGIRCTTCGRRVLVPRRRLERRVRRFVSRAPGSGSDRPDA